MQITRLIRPLSTLGKALRHGATHATRTGAAIPTRTLLAGSRGLLLSAANPALIALELQEITREIQHWQEAQKRETERNAYAQQTREIAQRLHKKGATQAEISFLNDLITHGAISLESAEHIYDTVQAEPGWMHTVAEKWVGEIPTLRKYINQPTQPFTQAEQITQTGELPWTPTETSTPRPLITHTPTAPIRPTQPTPAWHQTYRTVFGENYQPGLEPIRADVQALPVAPPQTMTVKTGIFRDPRYGKNLPKNHPQYEAEQGRTFRIKPLHQWLTEAANRAQNRLPAGIHAAPVEPTDTTLITRKRTPPVTSPLARRR